MKSKEFEKLINNSYNKEMQAIYDNLKQVLNIPDDDLSATAAESTQNQKPAANRRSSFKNFFKAPARLAACVSAAVAVACLAVILPFTLKGGNGQQAATPPSTSDNPSISDDRLCAAAACKEIELKYSLKDYSDRNNLSLLYVDWYDVADIKTSLYVNKENSFDIVYYQEILMHKYTGSIVELYITDLRTNVDILLDYMKACKYQYTPKNPRATVYWGSDTVENGEHNIYTASILYENRVYVLVLRYPMPENNILDLIDSMLPAYKMPAYKR